MSRFLTRLTTLRIHERCKSSLRGVLLAVAACRHTEYHMHASLLTARTARTLSYPLSFFLALPPFLLPPACFTPASRRP